MPIGSSLSITLPTVYSPPSTGTTGPTWATDLNTALTAIITAIETRVTPDGLNINDDVEFNGYEAQELGAVGFENKASAFSGASNIRKIYVRDGELYYNDSSGNQVQITTAGRLNSAAIGGINGDYGGAFAASLYYTQSTATYAFLSSAALRAIIDAGQVLVRETGTSGYAVKLTNPGTLTGDVTRTLLGANPASTSLLAISSAGTESATRSPSLDAITIADDAVLHASLTKTLPATAYVALSGAGNIAPNALAPGRIDATGACSVMYNLPVEVGERLVSVLVRCEDDSNTAMTVQIFKCDSAGSSQLTGATMDSLGTGALQSVFCAPSTPETIVTATGYLIVITSIASSDIIYNVSWIVDRVA